MRTLVLATIMLAGLQACATTSATQPPAAPIVQPSATPVLPPPTAVQAPRPYDGHVTFFSNWLPPAGTDLDVADPTARFTNAQMLAFDCDNTEAADSALRARANADGRAIILHSGLMGWGNDGYAVVDEPTRTQCWDLERQFIRDYRARILFVHTSDEPPDVAWSHWVDGGTRYDPNRYNGDLSKICAIVHGDFADLPCAVNFGSLPPGLQVAPGINYVLLETYDQDWHAKLDTLAGLTSLPLGLMPPGSLAGDPAQLDAQKAAIVLAEWTEAQANPRVTGLLFFLYCCPDLVTGDKNFHTVSGGDLPLTLAALQSVGQQIRNGR